MHDPVQLVEPALTKGEIGQQATVQRPVCLHYLGAEVLDNLSINDLARLEVAQAIGEFDHVHHPPAIDGDNQIIALAGEELSHMSDVPVAAPGAPLQ